MSEQARVTGRWKNGAAGAALAVAIGLLFLPHPLGQGLADLSFDLPFRPRPNLPVENVMIIYMDQDSARKTAQNWENGPWDRAQHARLLDRLRECKAQAVVFDIRFEGATTNDALLAGALRAAHEAGMPVVLGGEMRVVDVGGGSTLTNVLAPIESLPAPWGVAELGTGSAILRQHFGGTDRVPSIAWRAAELTAPESLKKAPPERWINYYGPPGFLPHRTYSDALDPRLTDTNTFADKVCFVGAWPQTTFAGPTRSDEWETPYSRWGGGKAPGVEINATVYLNLIRPDWLRRIPGTIEVLLLIFSGAILGLGLGICRPTIAAGLGIAAALLTAIAAYALMWQQRVWFSWLIVVAVQIPVAVVWSVLAYTKQLSREKHLLEAKLATASETGEAGTLSAAPAKSLSQVDTSIAQTLDDSAVAGREQKLAVPDHTLLRKVGKGAYGEVWLARNAIGTFHAVKIIRRQNFDRAEPFEREFRGLQKFMPISHSHPGLVLVLHVGRHDEEGFIYYIMEVADDENTGQQIDPQAYSPKNLAREIHKRGHLPAAECLQLGLNLSGALEFLHEQKLIHRDIKPSNIIFVKGVPKFADIGLVTEIAGPGQAVTFVGTAGYLPPEGPGTRAADVFSLGKVLYEASMGLGCEQFPELSATLLERPDRAQVLQLNAILLKACRQEVNQRYQTAAEMRQDLLRLDAAWSAAR